jgi:hypothetical protein
VKSHHLGKELVGIVARVPAQRTVLTTLGHEFLDTFHEILLRSGRFGEHPHRREAGGGVQGDPADERCAQEPVLAADDLRGDSADSRQGKQRQDDSTDDPAGHAAPPSGAACGASGGRALRRQNRAPRASTPWTQIPSRKFNVQIPAPAPITSMLTRTIQTNPDSQQMIAPASQPLCSG